MIKFFEKFMRFWMFRFRNPVVRAGEKGGFRWKFRRFWLEITTLSGNFKARFTASDHPYAYLLCGTTDDNIEGFCETMYMIGTLITTDRQFVVDVQDAVKSYMDRLSNEKQEREDDDVALEEVKAIQEHIELPERERRKVERKIERNFKKAAKEAAKHESE